MSVQRVVASSGPQALQAFATDVNRALQALDKDTADAIAAAVAATLVSALAADNKPARLLKANLPTDDSIRLAIVTDETGGEVLAFFTSANQWRRVTDRAVVA